ncbi:hypothetical protein IMCC9480_276 [Oxalobacteraceae bacterium IMCC9480]|nr:hypothetical protein IMCC9480_276 [Oxalobacteraceae bacterium IMCC9480]
MIRSDYSSAQTAAVCAYEWGIAELLHLLTDAALQPSGRG